jgi:hypothetical protein
MVYKEHFIELWINGSKVELEDQKSLNMRFNNVITDPTKISSNQAEYSFEFEIPATPKNNVILDYANNLGKLNKFHQRYNAEVYADGTVIFSGTITINGFKDKKYQLNLVSPKVYSLDDIFGDSVMSSIGNYNIEFDGVSSINDYNGQLEAPTMFPLVSYGAFKKNPYNKDNVASDFTSKFDLDQYNDWYIESFYPSANVTETLRKAFEWKGYNVGGNVFQDKYLRDIYMSTNLADGQTPDYNIGNPVFGSVDLSALITTNQNNTSYQQELNFPYYRVTAKESNITFESQEEYNFSAINLFNVLKKGNVTVNQEKCYMYQPNENIIVIPADGFYKIEMSVTSTLNTTSQFTAAQYTHYNQADEELNEEDLLLTPSLSEITPLEIHLVRNYEDNIELIKGKNNTEYIDGNPNDLTWSNNRTNIINWQTCFPHEDPYNSDIPTKQNELGLGHSSSRNGGRRDSSSTTGRREGQRTRGGTIDITGSDRAWSYMNFGYIYNDGEIMAYDQAVSDAFICGFSSMKGGTVAVMKNGYSWSPINSEKNEAFYPEIGYSKLTRQAGTGNLVTEQTDYNSNIYINTPISYIHTDNRNMSGSLSCMVYLKRNDKLELMAVQREYHTVIGNDVGYSTTSNLNLKISAASPRSYNQLKADHFEYYSPTEFDVLLNVPNFFNKETKISDWVQQVSDAFNLEIIQNGKNVTINTRKKPNLTTAVDIDDRCNYSEAELKVIDYPKSMAIKYKIDDDEWGFERSAVNAAGGDDAILNNDAWKKYADSGYTVIQLNDDSYVTSNSDKNLQFSYTWYDTFHWYGVNDKFEKTTDTAVDIRIPVISKFTYMIDGYDYLESMKHDGYGLAQRFWFKPSNSGCYVWTRTYPPERVFLYLPTNLYTNYRDVYLNLSYKNTENSLLNQFFNINAYLASNYVLIDVYLSADEYNRIKNGALVKFDDDLYIPVEVSGYDPSGNNATTLKLMKKVA